MQPVQPTPKRCAPAESAERPGQSRTCCALRGFAVTLPASTELGRKLTAISAVAAKVPVKSRGGTEQNTERFNKQQRLRG